MKISTLLSFIFFMVCLSCQNQTDTVKPTDIEATIEVENTTDIEDAIEVENTIPQTSLKGTKWKLAGIVDTETGVLKVLEPEDCEKCYTLTFDTDTTVSTYSSFNELGGGYIVDYIKRSFQITNFGGTKAGELGDGGLYVGPFWNRTVQSFFYKKSELRLYYDENRNYLLYKLQKQ
jgi:hypothetical protein